MILCVFATPLWHKPLIDFSLRVPQNGTEVSQNVAKWRKKGKEGERLERRTGSIDVRRANLRELELLLVNERTQKSGGTGVFQAQKMLKR